MPSCNSLDIGIMVTECYTIEIKDFSIHHGPNELKNAHDPAQIRRRGWGRRRKLLLLLQFVFEPAVEQRDAAARDNHTCPTKMAD